MFGAFTFGAPQFGQAPITVRFRLLNICHTANVDLMPARFVLSLTPERDVAALGGVRGAIVLTPGRANESLTPLRRVKRHCS